MGVTTAGVDGGVERETGGGREIAGAINDGEEWGREGGSPESRKSVEGLHGRWSWREIGNGENWEVRGGAAAGEEDGESG